MSQPIHLGNSKRSFSMDRVLKGIAHGAKETAVSLFYMLAFFGFLSGSFGYLDHVIYAVWLFVEDLFSFLG